MHSFKSFFIVIFIFLPLSVFANAVTDELNQQLAGLQSMQANFEQKILDQKGLAIQKTSGQMALQRPGKFRWYTRAPNKQLLIADGKTLWIYDEDLAQVTKRKQISNTNTATPAMLLSGSMESLMNDFTITKLDKSNDIEQWFQLVPKDQNNMFQSVQLGFQQGELHDMRLVSNLGQFSVLKFSDIKRNPQLDAKLFRFKPPKGVDVVNE